MWGSPTFNNLTKLERQIMPFLHSRVARCDYYQKKTSPYVIMESSGEHNILTGDSGVKGNVPHMDVKHYSSEELNRCRVTGDQSDICLFNFIHSLVQVRKSIPVPPPQEHRPTQFASEAVAVSRLNCEGYHGPCITNVCCKFTVVVKQNNCFAYSKVASVQQYKPWMVWVCL